ncbi:MAG: helix-turn-helix domain-containing protein [Rhodobacteraceae bacterium]|nr:helix-turn-helix domain-containing protein [Paracoccaceae bacterium]
MDAGALPGAHRLDRRAAPGGSDDLLGLLGHLPDRGGRRLRRPGGDGALDLRAPLRSALPGRRRPTRTGARRLRGARRTRDLGRLDELARPRALPDRTRGRPGGGAGGLEVLRPAAPRRRPRALHGVRPAPGPRRRAGRRRARLARRPCGGRGAGARGGAPVGPLRTRLRPALPCRHRPRGPRLRPEPPHRAGQAPPRAHRRAVEDVAWRVGYEDPAAFRRLFRRTAGVTPGKYRRQFAQPLA